MMGFLTCFGTVLLLISKLVMAIGEVIALLTFLTCSRTRVTKVRTFFDSVSTFLVIDIDQFTFDGIQQLQYNSLIFFQDIPLLIIQVLIFTEVLNCKELLEDSLTFYISFGSTVLNMVTFFFIKRLEMQAANESFIMICLEGMTANISWLPHSKKIRDYDNPNLNIDFGNLKTSIPFFTKSLGFYFQVNFQFNDITLKSFITEITKRVSAQKLLRADDDQGQGQG